MRPEVGSITAPRLFRSVDLPEPDGPMRPTTSPGATVMSTPFKASTAVSPEPYRFFSPSTFMPLSVMSSSDRLGRVDLERRLDGDETGERAYEDHGEESGDGVARHQQDVLGKSRRPERRRDLAHHETDQAKTQCLLQNHRRDRAVLRPDELQDGDLANLADGHRIDDERDYRRAHDGEDHQEHSDLPRRRRDQLADEDLLHLRPRVYGQALPAGYG